MKQGLQVMRGDAPTPSRFRSPRLNLRAIGEEGEQMLRDATITLAKSLPAYPDKELFKVIRAERGRNISPATLLTGVVTVAYDPDLSMSAWAAFRAKINGWLDTLVTPVSRSYGDVWKDETKAQCVADIAQQEAAAACESGDVPRINAAIEATQAVVWQGQIMVATLVERKRQVLAKRSAPVTPCFTLTTGGAA